MLALSPISKLEVGSFLSQSSPDPSAGLFVPLPCPINVTAPSFLGLLNHLGSTPSLQTWCLVVYHILLTFSLQFLLNVCVLLHWSWIRSFLIQSYSFIHRPIQWPIYWKPTVCWSITLYDSYSSLQALSLIGRWGAINLILCDKFYNHYLLYN